MLDVQKPEMILKFHFLSKTKELIDYVNKMDPIKRRKRKKFCQFFSQSDMGQEQIVENKDIKLEKIGHAEI